jgi:hypothetical protein
MPASQPLTGVGIVEYGRDLPARYAGFLLAELGAEVTALRGADYDWHPVLMTKLGVDMSQLPAARLMGPAAQQIKNALEEQQKVAKAAAS